MAEPRGERRGIKADATRQVLLDAAVAVIGEKGYTSATVDEIVARAGVSKGLAYYHFKSKAAMAQSVLEEGIEDLITGFERISCEASAGVEALTGMIELFATDVFENKNFGRFLVSELWREGRVWSGSMRSFEGRLLMVIESQLLRGQNEGVIRPEIDARFVAVALVGMVLTTTLYYLGGQGHLFDTSTGLSSALDRETPASECTPVSVDKDAFIEQICDFVRHANALHLQYR